MSHPLCHEPVLLRAILTSAGVCTSSLIAVLSEAANSSCRDSWFGPTCIAWYIGIILTLPIACALLWYGMTRDDRDELIKRFRLTLPWCSALLMGLAIGCAFLAWSTFWAIRANCPPSRWGFDCSSHSVGVIMLTFIAISCGCLAVRRPFARQRESDRATLLPTQP